MRMVLGLFSVFFVGFCCGETTESVFDYDMTTIGQYGDKDPVKCGPNSYCVHVSQCKNDKIIQDGSEVVQPRGEACGAHEQCCELETPDTPETSETPATSETPPQSRPICGVRNISGLNRQTQNMNRRSKFGEFPWMLIVCAVASNEIHSGASLIHPKIALTSAHNVNKFKADELRVIAGKSTLGGTTDLYPSQERTVSEKVQHELFDRVRLKYDIALLFLSQPFDLQPHIGTVCLPPPAFDIGLITCYAIIYEEESINPPYPSDLKKIDLPIEPNDSCQNLLRKTRLTRFFKLHESFICAGGELDKDTCVGNGGSPLVCPIPNQNSRYYQAGIVSWGIDCQTENIPGVYASIPYLRSWVDEKLADRNMDKSFYTI